MMQKSTENYIWSGFRPEKLHLMDGSAHVGYCPQPDSSTVPWLTNSPTPVIHCTSCVRSYHEINGELKEKGDVEIKDASPVVFGEFLNFFYGQPMQLSMENITDVLKLADKYDAKDCLPICIDFLKENLTSDDLVWAFHLALQFQLDDLKLHCKNVIQGNFEKVMALFDVKEDGTVQLLSNPDDRFVSEKEIERVYLRICAMSKSVISKLSAEVDLLCDSRIIPYTLVKEVDKKTKVEFMEYEIIRFELTGDSLMLTDLFCSNVFNWRLERVDANLEMIVGKICSSSSGFSQKVKLEKYGENHVKLTNPICISDNETWFLLMKSVWLVRDEKRHTYKAMGTEGKYTRSLITRMCFAPIAKK